MASQLYRPLRNAGCRIVDDLTFKGYRSLLLENESLLIHLLLDRGGEPVRWQHKPTDTDFIWLSQRGIDRPHPLYSNDYEISYLGGWQEMFPEVSYTSVYRNTTVHRGESAITPWDYTILQDDPERIEVQLVNRIRSMPFRTEKKIALTSGSAVVRIEETIVNLSSATALEANWGHHLAYGAPFLDRDTVAELTEGATVHHPATGESWPWPAARQNGAEVDLSRLPEPGTPRDLLYVRAADGKYRLTNRRRGVSLEVRWDQEVWPYLWYWQNFGHDSDAPFFGRDYNIGLEMFNVPPKLTLAEAAAQGLALVVPPNGSVSAWLEFEAITNPSID
ncbi:DUF4432 family protein [Paenibacillus cymbidii]|uniref:DUF4432 family protein n=1 Tax=Paenibacillus cymbidii TaxID=1639034 RepID=UPI001081A4C8|nr:DUF4432 family protein [Paenibacillus cymbidii]